MWKWSADLLKWVILIVLLSAIVYYCRPRYEYLSLNRRILQIEEGFICRCDKYTGEVNIYTIPHGLPAGQTFKVLFEKPPIRLSDIPETKPMPR